MSIADQRIVLIGTGRLLAERHGVALSPFQNRRWDSDFQTLNALIQRGHLGEVVQYESHFDRFRPLVRDRWREKPGAGVLLGEKLGALFPKLVAGGLIAVGLYYLIRYALSPPHHAEKPARRYTSDAAAIAGLIALVTFTPSEAVLPVYLANLEQGWTGFLLLSAVASLKPRRRSSMRSRRCRHCGRPAGRCSAAARWHRPARVRRAACRARR
mgnify:CR=1 FL=1